LPGRRVKSLFKTLYQLYQNLEFPLIGQLAECFTSSLAEALDVKHVQMHLEKIKIEKLNIITKYRSSDTMPQRYNRSEIRKGAGLARTHK